MRWALRPLFLELGRPSCLSPSSPPQIPGKQVSMCDLAAGRAIMMIQSGNIRDPPVNLPRRVDWVTNVLDTADTSS